MAVSTLKWGLLATVIPYLIGLLISSKAISPNFFHAEASSLDDIMAQQRRVDEIDMMDSCFASFDKAMQFKELGNPFEGLHLKLHRNGELEPCGVHAKGIVHAYRAMQRATQNFEYCPDRFNKYDVEAFLTLAFAAYVMPPDMCPSKDDKGIRIKDHAPFISYCDAGEDRTPILTDYNKLKRVPGIRKGLSSLPCRFYTREGVRISSLRQLSELGRKSQSEHVPCDGNEKDQTCSATPELHLYAVPAGRVFIFAPSYVGEVFELPHVNGPQGLPVSLEVLSLQPRVFDIHNFFTREESSSIVAKALAETSETHRIKRSSTGATGYTVNARRTSENGFDTHGKTSMLVKKRCFEVLGFDEYLEGHADGLQVLRYNKTTAYIPHMDWIDDAKKQQVHNYDSGGVGGNRFATILLYMSDLNEGDGGETVFANAWPTDVPESERIPEAEALRILRESGDARFLARGSWEEKMVAQCRTRLAVRPHSSRAVLFYSQQPNGKPDNDSLHGGCPVLHGEKWAANLWVWNTPREGYEGNPKNEANYQKQKKETDANKPQQLHATFTNTGTDPTFANAELYFQETFWGKFGHGDPSLSVNTYEGHVWNVMVDEKAVKTFVINKELVQNYKV